MAKILTDNCVVGFQRTGDKRPDRPKYPKTGCKIRTVDLFCAIKVFLLHISKSRPECHFVNNYRMDHPHQGHMSHMVIWSLIPNSIVKLRDGRQCL